MTVERTVLLTGATGLVGAYLLDRLARTTGTVVHALVRSRPGMEPRDRVDELGRFFARTDLADVVHIHAGDVAKPGLGIDSEVRERLRMTVTDVIHAAGLVSLAAPHGRLTLSNVDGTRHVMELAPASARFFHVSTAYVAGLYGGVFGETELNVGQTFRNAYEQSKFAAETLVRQLYRGREGLLTVLRPSIVVGEFSTGRIPKFANVYMVLGLLGRFGKQYPGETFFMPYSPEGTQNYIPVDDMTDMFMEVFDMPDRWGETYHLVNPFPVRNGEFRTWIESQCGIRIENRTPDASCRPLNRQAIRRASEFIEYLQGEPRFDCANRNLLHAAPRRPGFDRDFLRRTMAYWDERQEGLAHGHGG